MSDTIARGRREDLSSLNTLSSWLPRVFRSSFRSFGMYRGSVERIITHIVEISSQDGRFAGTGRTQHNRLEAYRCGIPVPSAAMRGRRCVAVHHWHMLCLF